MYFEGVALFYESDVSLQRFDMFNKQVVASFKQINGKEVCASLAPRTSIIHWGSMFDNFLRRNARWLLRPTSVKRLKLQSLYF
jgi:hypothetical protein